MPPPTVTSVTPATGISRRGGLVTVAGTNFDTVGVVTVAFGSRLAFDVRVISATALTCVPPIGEIPDLANTLAVTVTVTNVDLPPVNFGSLASAYTYRRPSVAAETHLTAAVRTLLQRMKQQIIKNVSITTHTDWDQVTSDLKNRVEAAALPAVVLLGPTLMPHRVTNYNERTLTTSGDPATSYTRHHPPRAVTLQFEVRLMSASKWELLNLLAHATLFAHRTGVIEGVPRDPSIPGAGTVDYGLTIVEEFSAVDRPSRANVREAVGRWRVEGVLLESGDLLESAPTIDVTELTSEQMA